MPDITNIPQSQPLNVLEKTSDSITVTWDLWEGLTTKEDHLVYRVSYTEEENIADPWHVAKEGNCRRKFTIKNLKPETSYGITVEAFDEFGHLVCQYPSYHGCVTVKTNETDTQAPTADIRAINVLEASHDRIVISWQAATDNETEAKDIRYTVHLTESENPSDPWHQVGDAKNITTFTFTGLKENIRYGFFVRAYDKAGNTLQYPLDNGCMTAVTKADGPTIIYQTSGTVHCDGVYDGSGAKNVSALKVNLGSKLNRKYFEISFKFYPISTDEDGRHYENILTLDSSYRIFGLTMSKGRVHVTVNNRRQEYSTSIGVTRQQWHDVHLIYDNGLLTINGIDIQIGAWNEGGNNVLCSMNYSNGNAFHGDIKDLVFKTK